ncbi:MAG: transglycosylase SLT domain-containing protein [Burkholderiaceae bacterium]
MIPAGRRQNPDPPRPVLLGCAGAAIFTLAFSFLASAALARAPAAQALQPVASLTADDAFLALREAVRNGDLDGAALYGQRVLSLEPAYPLAAYIEYYALSQRLKSLTDPASDDEVRSFIARNPDSLVADLARRDWLLALGRRGDFVTFDSELPKFVLGDDPQVNCYALAAHYLRLARTPESVTELVLSQSRGAVLVPKDIQGDGCAGLASLLAGDGHLSSAEIWKGARLASDNNLQIALKRYLALLPVEESPKPEAIDAIYDKPALWLARRSGESVRGQQDLIVLALSRMARSAPDETAAQFERSWSNRLSADARAQVWAELAAAAAKRLMPQALEWARRSEDATDLSEDLLAWRARAALREQNWPLVALFIDKMPADMRRPQAYEGTWTYWMARARKAEGNQGEANILYSTIVGQFNFYGQLASEELGQPLVLPAQAQPTTALELAEVQSLPGFARAMKFYQLNLRPQGNLEWNYTLRGMSDRQLLAAAEFARRNQVYDRAVNTADRTHTEHDFAVRFLAPFYDAMQAKARALDLDLDWVYGLIRQESRFVMGAHSSAGASGLMQLMPGTARYVARKIGMTDYRPDQVADMDTNLLLGTNYLRMVLDQLDDVELLATAAYNAGPGRPKSWRSLQTRPLEGAIFAETIPLSETRDYVKKVMSNAVYYGLLFDPAKPQSLKRRLGTISPEQDVQSSDLP